MGVQIILFIFIVRVLFYFGAVCIPSVLIHVVPCITLYPLLLLFYDIKNLGITISDLETKSKG